MTRQAIILAGGKGTRLRARLGSLPKPLVDVDGVPLLGRQIAALRASGFLEILLLVNHGADQIESYCAEPGFTDLSLTLLDDGEPAAPPVLFSMRSNSFHRGFWSSMAIHYSISISIVWQGTKQRSRCDVPCTPTITGDPVDRDRRERKGHGFSQPTAIRSKLAESRQRRALRRGARGGRLWRERHTNRHSTRSISGDARRGARLQGYVSFEYIKDIGTPARLDRAVGHLRAGVIERARRDRPQKVSLPGSRRHDQ
jgi:NDP-sugar pyrophosphorylase family protein